MTPDERTDMQTTDAGGTPVERPVVRPSLSEMLDELSLAADGACPCQDLPTDCSEPCLARVAKDAYNEAAEAIRRGHESYAQRRPGQTV